MEAQRAGILAGAKRRGWTEVRLTEDADHSGKSTKRPSLAFALEALKRGEAVGLVVSKMARLNRSLLDFVQIVDVAQRQGWALIALDCPVDPSTPRPLDRRGDDEHCRYLRAARTPADRSADSRSFGGEARLWRAPGPPARAPGGCRPANHCRPRRGTNRSVLSPKD